jgi:hypothetical protein
MAPKPPGMFEFVGMGQLLLVLLFWLLLKLDHDGIVSIVDPEYKENGFCVSERPAQSANSFLLCFICDTLLCLLALSFKGAERHYGHILTVFAHGVAHLSQYLYGWPLPDENRWVFNVVYPLFAVAFVGGFGVGFKVGTKLHLALVSCALEVYRRAFVSDAFVFAYTNAWIYFLAAVTQITIHNQAEQKGYKSIKSWPAHLAITAGAIVPFFEGILCNSGVKLLGGHAIFDFAVGLGTVLLVASDPMDAEKSKLK